MMPHLPTRVAGLAIVVTALFACESDPVDQGSAGPAAEPRAGQAVVASGAEAIQALVDAQLAAWSAKDPDAFAATYAVDARFFGPIGDVYDGREGIRAAHDFLFSGPFAPSSETQVITQIGFLTGAIAVAHLDAALTGYGGLPPGLSPTEPGVLRTTKTWVVVKRAGSWQILRQHMAPVAPDL
ncbi:MAG TPA: SgcJ/EcaC family oxidoreductase [Gemmatimonadales bacterium]